MHIYTYLLGKPYPTPPLFSGSYPHTSLGLSFSRFVRLVCCSQAERGWQGQGHHRREERRPEQRQRYSKQVRV